MDHWLHTDFRGGAIFKPIVIQVVALPGVISLFVFITVHEKRHIGIGTISKV